MGRRFKKSFLLVPLILLCISAQTFADSAPELKQLKTTGICNGCDLEHVDLRGADLSGNQLRWAKLSHSNLTGANLKGADLTGADLSHALLTNTQLEGAVLQGSRLSGVDLSEARLVGADLRWADMTHLDVDLALEHIDLIGVLLEGARFKNGVRCGAFPPKGGFGCTAVQTNR